MKIKIIWSSCNALQFINKHATYSLPNKQFLQLINNSPHSSIMLNTINTEFLFIDVWFTDQNIKPLEIEDNVNMTFVIESVINALFYWTKRKKIC